VRAACLMLVLVAGLAAGILPPVARADATDELLRGLATCERALDPELDVGYRRITELCPALVEQLGHSPWSALFPSGWDLRDSQLSAGGLAELGQLIERERSASGRGAAGARPPPSAGLLAPVLRDLGAADEERGGLWARLKRWLRSVSDTRDDTPGSGWASRLLRRIDPGEAVLRALGYAALAVIVVLALAIVMNELRAAGLLRPAGRRRAAGRLADDATTLAAPTLRDLTRVAVTERPALLLRLVIDALTRTHRLPPAGSLTARELTTTARIDSPEDRERLRGLAGAAERTRFAAVAPAPDELTPVLAGAEALLAGLERESEEH